MKGAVQALIRGRLLPCNHPPGPQYAAGSIRMHKSRCTARFVPGGSWLLSLVGGEAHGLPARKQGFYQTLESSSV